MNCAKIEEIKSSPSTKSNVIDTGRRRMQE